MTRLLKPSLTMDFKQPGFLASPLFLQTQNVLFILKEDFGPLSYSPVLLLPSGIVSAWHWEWDTCCPFPGQVCAWWLLMHWLQCQSTPGEAFPSSWIIFTRQVSQSCSYPCWLFTLSYHTSPFQSTWICFDAALCEQPAYSVMIYCVSECLLVDCQVSSLLHDWGCVLNQTEKLKAGSKYRCLELKKFYFLK